MATYVMLSRLAPDAFKEPSDLKPLAATGTLQATPWDKFIAAL